MKEDLRITKDFLKRFKADNEKVQYVGFYFGQAVAMIEKFVPAAMLVPRKIYEMNQEQRVGPEDAPRVFDAEGNEIDIHYVLKQQMLFRGERQTNSKFEEQYAASQ